MISGKFRGRDYLSISRAVRKEHYSSLVNISSRQTVVIHLFKKDSPFILKKINRWDRF